MGHNRIESGNGRNIEQSVLRNALNNALLADVIAAQSMQQQFYNANGGNPDLTNMELAYAPPSSYCAPINSYGARGGALYGGSKFFQGLSVGGGSALSQIINGGYGGYNNGIFNGGSGGYGYNRGYGGGYNNGIFNGGNGGYGYSGGLMNNILNGGGLLGNNILGGGAYSSFSNPYCAPPYSAGAWNSNYNNGRFNNNNYNNAFNNLSAADRAKLLNSLNGNQMNDSQCDQLKKLYIEEHHRVELLEAEVRLLKQQLASNNRNQPHAPINPYHNGNRNPYNNLNHGCNCGGGCNSCGGIGDGRIARAGMRLVGGMFLGSLLFGGFGRRGFR